jgi:DNA-binding MarR family transcriptional regulator
MAETPAELRVTMELFFFAYREFTGEADRLLSRQGFGRAHHRVIYFVARHPGISVGELQSILRVTKQSLARVLGDLRTREFIVQGSDPKDRRRRRLYLTPQSEALERTLTDRQAAWIARAFAHVDAAAVTGFRAVLSAMIDRDDRPGLVRATDGKGDKTADRDGMA